MPLVKLTHLLFAHNVLSTHAQYFWMICNTVLLFERKLFKRVYASDDHFPRFKNGILCVQCFGCRDTGNNMLCSNFNACFLKSNKI